MIEFEDNTTKGPKIKVVDSKRAGVPLGEPFLGQDPERY